MVHHIARRFAGGAKLTRGIAQLVEGNQSLFRAGNNQNNFSLRINVLV